MTRKALADFHYAADGRNATLYRKGSEVPVRDEHVAQLVADGSIEGDKPAPAPGRPKARKKRS